jgi:hypothetical protein
MCRSDSTVARGATVTLCVVAVALSIEFCCCSSSRTRNSRRGCASLPVRREQQLLLPFTVALSIVIPRLIHCDHSLAAGAATLLGAFDSHGHLTSDTLGAIAREREKVGSGAAARPRCSDCHHAAALLTQQLCRNRRQRRRRGLVEQLQLLLPRAAAVRRRAQRLRHRPPMPLVRQRQPPTRGDRCDSALQLQLQQRWWW